jgi:Ca2+:H+ antiporter
MPRWLYFLLLFTVLAIVFNFFSFPPLLLFVVAGLGIVPLAALIGVAVEEIAERTGERIGGLLFATFGNATELIIGILALTKGLVSVVSASIIGSILGNALLVLGIAVCIGGFAHGRLHFEARPASQYASLLALSIGGLLLPTIAMLFAERVHQPFITEHLIALSDFVAVLLLLGYISFILFSIFGIGDKGENLQDQQEREIEQQEPLFGPYSAAALTRLLAYRHQIAHGTATATRSGVLRQLDSAANAVAQDININASKSTVLAKGSNSTDIGNPPASAHMPVRVTGSEDEEKAPPPLWRSIGLLALATIGVAILSEILVGTIDPMTTALHWNPAFVGLIFVPLIGSIPEYFNTINMALDKRMGMVLASSAGSSIQIALLMAPILVLISLFMPGRLDLVFSLVEISVLALATFLFSEITKDGELVWLEGFLLILLYAMMGGTVFLFGNA